MNTLYDNYKMINDQMYRYVKENAKQYFDTFCKIMIEVYSDYPNILSSVIPKDCTKYVYDSYDNNSIYFRKNTKTGKLSMSKDAERFSLPLKTLFENYPETLRIAAKQVLDEYNRAIEGTKNAL